MFENRKNKDEPTAMLENKTSSSRGKKIIGAKFGG